VKNATIEHNKRFMRGEVTFRRTLNMFADLSKDERKHIAKGFKPPLVTIQSRSVSVVSSGMFPAGPPSINWNARGHVTPVKDQAFYCDNCEFCQSVQSADFTTSSVGWAFSSLAAVESHFSIYRNWKGQLSEQQLIDCNRNSVTGNWGCAGGSQASAYMYIKENGIASSEAYPYNEDVQHTNVYPCRYNSTTSVGKLTGYYRLRPNNETLLRDAIAALGPAAISIDGSLESFMYYENGIFDDPACPKGLSHSALIVGYGTENGINYWLCKNSW